MPEGSFIFILLGLIVVAFLVITALRSRAEAEKQRRWEEDQQRFAEEENKRQADLMAKYNDEDVVNKIMNGKIWEGMTEEQLLESLGEPIEKDEKKYKTKIRQTYKYDQTGQHRFGTRIFVENGIVIGWDLK